MSRGQQFGAWTANTSGQAMTALMRLIEAMPNGGDLPPDTVRTMGTHREAGGASAEHPAYPIRTKQL